MKDSQILSCLLDLDHAGFDAVISSEAYPIEILDDFAVINQKYLDKHGYYLNMVTEEIMDTGIPHPELCHFDYDKVSKEMYFLCDEYMKRLRGLSTNQLYFNYIASYVSRLKVIS